VLDGNTPLILCAAPATKLDDGLKGTIERPAFRTDASPIFPPHSGQHSGIKN